VYLHQLDARLTTAGWRLIRYADDFVVMTDNEAGAHRARAATEAALQGLRLELSPRKTQVTSFEAGFDFLGVRFYRDTYSYDWQGKRVEVKGRNIRWLYRHVPQFY
jgi:retron-type reverse transcriptase